MGNTPINHDRFCIAGYVAAEKYFSRITLDQLLLVWEIIFGLEELFCFAQNTRFTRRDSRKCG